MPKKCFRVVKTQVVYIVTDNANDAEVEARDGYGIPVEPNIEAFEVAPEEMFKAIAGVEDGNGGHYNEDGTAWVYNDEYWETYQLNLETGYWEPIDPMPWDEVEHPDYYNADDPHNQAFADLDNI